MRQAAARPPVPADHIGLSLIWLRLGHAALEFATPFVESAGIVAGLFGVGVVCDCEALVRSIEAAAPADGEAPASGRAGAA